METTQQAISRGVNVERLPNIIHPSEVRGRAINNNRQVRGSTLHENLFDGTIYSDAMNDLPRLQMVWGEDNERIRI